MPLQTLCLHCKGKKKLESFTSTAGKESTSFPYPPIHLSVKMPKIPPETWGQKGSRKHGLSALKRQKTGDGGVN